jgi:hypothetical protein
MPEATVTRDEMIEQHIQERALVSLLTNLTYEGWEGAPLHGLFDYTKLCEIADRMESWEEYRKLWPEDEDQERAEVLLANLRVQLLTSRIFMALAEDPNYLRERAAHFVWLAERDALKLGALGAEDTATSQPPVPPIPVTTSSPTIPTRRARSVLAT